MTWRSDVCIIGAGVAGSLLAADLTERGRSVTLLEAGPWFEPADRAERMERYLRPGYPRSSVWDMEEPRDAYVSDGHSYPLNEHRVKGIGGSSLHWRGRAPRLYPEDFGMRTRHDVARDWPISYTILWPYFLEAERALGVAGAEHPLGPPRNEPFPMEAHPPSRMDELLEYGFDSIRAPLHPYPVAINPEPYGGRVACDGYGTCQPVCPSRAKYSADVHAATAASAGAAVIDRATVHGLRHDPSGRRIVAADFVRDGEGGTVEADTFVLAAGAIESARLLLLSASDQFPNGLGNGSGLVGRYLMKQPAVGLTGRIEVSTGSDQIGFETSRSAFYYPHHRGREGSIHLTVRNAPGPPPTRTALQRDPFPDRVVEGDPLAPLRGDPWSDELPPIVGSEYRGRVSVTASVEQLPVGENRVTLDDSTTDHLGNPVPAIDFSIDQRTRRVLGRAQELLDAIFDAVGASGVTRTGSQTVPELGFDHMGTTRMGADPESSVVNPDLRVHELENLFVSSSGVFVTAGALPPTLTEAALSLRLAEHLDGSMN